MTATLTILAPEAPARATRYGAAAFAAFRISESNRTYPSQIDGDPATLAEAVDIAKLRCFHKERLVIRETDRDGAVKLHVYAIRQSSKARPVYRDYQTTMVRDLYAEPVCSIDGAVL
jgi:hypothetical protein